MIQITKLLKGNWILITMSAFLLFSSCHHGEISEKLQLAEEQIWENPDSALKVLEDIPSPNTLEGKEQADYALLLTQAQYRSDILANSDSLINVAVDYYQDRKYVDKRAASVFLRGEILTELKRDEEAMLMYKEAESHILQIHDARIKSRIYNSLGYLNKKHGNYQLAMTYYKKALGVDVDEKYLSWKVGDLINLANVSFQFESVDSANLYYNQALEMAPSVDSALQAKIYHNLALCKNKEGDWSGAEKYFLKSLYLSRGIDTYKTQFLLASIYNKVGYKEKADSLWNAVLCTSDIAIRVNVYHTLYKESIERGEFEQAVSRMEICMEAVDSFRTKVHQSKMLEIQKKYDQMVLLKENADIQKRWYVTILISLLVIGCLGLIFYVSLLIYRKKKMNELIKYQNEKIDVQQRIDEYQIRIEEDETLHHDEKEDLLKKIELLREEMKEKDVQIHRMEIIHKSKDIPVPIEYVEALKVYLKINSENPSYVPAGDRASLRCWLDIIYDGFASRLVEKYALTSREQDVCFLKALKLSDEKIAFLLNNQLRSVDRCVFRVYEKSFYLGSKAEFIQKIIIQKEI